MRQGYLRPISQVVCVPVLVSSIPIHGYQDCQRYECDERIQRQKKHVAKFPRVEYTASGYQKTSINQNQVPQDLVCLCCRCNCGANTAHKYLNPNGKIANITTVNTMLKTRVEVNDISQLYSFVCVLKLI
ncbi:Hypothetical_protein [Hexamita inflata]|uniref:Hypothetical_protein n=1 Tax=Hexamita inflata TaxID=28002 RepID=A0AA86PY69_9EUKA|nr:Hypothetical protein HINF_LOCUS36200 [Hexamita inflata]